MNIKIKIFIFAIIIYSFFSATISVSAALSVYDCCCPSGGSCMIVERGTDEAVSCPSEIKWTKANRDESGCTGQVCCCLESGGVIGSCSVMSSGQCGGMSDYSAKLYTGSCDQYVGMATVNYPDTSVAVDQASNSKTETDSKSLQDEFNNFSNLANTKLNPAGFTGENALANIIGRITGFFAATIGSIALVLYIWAGFMWMTAAGNSDRVAKAQNVIIWTSLGVVAILSSYIIVKFVFTSLVPPSSV